MSASAEVATLVLDHGELPDAVFEGGVLGQPLGHPAPDPIADLLPSRDEDLLDEVLAADQLDGGEQAAGEPAVVGRKQLLRVVGHVVQVARASDAVLLGRVVDEPGFFKRVELLEDTRPARAEGRGERVGRCRAGLAEVKEDRPSQ